MGIQSQTIINIGMQAILVDVECHITNGLPAMVVVGSASRRVDESRERVRNAILTSGLQYPRKRIVVNLAPGDIQKEGTSLDLSIAVAILTASKQLTPESIDNHILIGELSLDGQLRPVRGLIGMLIGARNSNKTYVIPSANLSQAKAIQGIKVIGLESLMQVYDYFKSGNYDKFEAKDPASASATVSTKDYIDLQDITGQPLAKRALEIAAAGGHNVLLTGPPGTGKSMLAKAFCSLLPPPSQDEILEITHLHSLVNSQYESLVTARPFRSPHHTASQSAITGGGSPPRPGEISLSHNGVLFLDELPEFARQTIESLRQPLEEGYITIARARDNVRFPASFILIATANPCPCGYFGSDTDCICSPAQIQNYGRKLSGPIIDRIDMHVMVDGVDHKNLLSNNQNGESTDLVKMRVISAHERQIERNSKINPLPKSVLNAHMSNQMIRQSCNLTPEAKALINSASTKFNLSARSYMRTIKVAKTIADLDNQEVISVLHISEALQYRRKLSEVPAIIA